MPAYAATGLENVYARVFVGQGDEFPDVDAGFVADEREFVGKGDLHVARGVFGQFAHFGCFGIGAVQLAFDEPGIKSDGFFGRGRVDAADHPVVVHQFVQDVSGQHAFGAVGDVELALQFGTVFEDKASHLVGGSYR